MNNKYQDNFFHFSYIGLTFFYSATKMVFHSSRVEQNIWLVTKMGEEPGENICFFLIFNKIIRKLLR